MRSLNSMLDEYALSHQNSFNKLIHKICVPTIMFSIIGLLWAIPRPLILGDFNWASVVSILIMLYYLVLSRKYFIIMLPVG